MCVGLLTWSGVFKLLAQILVVVRADVQLEHVFNHWKKLRPANERPNRGGIPHTWRRNKMHPD